MPIMRLLSNSELSPEQRHTLELAFNYTLRKLNLVDRNDPICDIVAHKVIELGKRGLTDAVAIGEMAHRQLAP